LEDLLVAVDPIEMPKVDIPEAMPDTLEPHKTKKNVEVQEDCFTLTYEGR
jgi:hypothetical protein